MQLTSWNKLNFSIHSFSIHFYLKNNRSTLPTHIKHLTNSCISSVTFSQDDIAKIIKNLDLSKTHGNDNIRIRVLNIYGPAIFKPLAIIFT